MVNAVETVMAGPEVVNFTGYLVIELADNDSAGSRVRRTVSGMIATLPGASVNLTVSVISDQFAKDAAPDRRAVDESNFVALETVYIDGGKTESVVDFEAVIDSATMTPSPHRIIMQVSRPNGERQATLTLLVPESEGVHEAWIQLFQAGQLVQAIVVTIDNRSDGE